MKLKLIIHKLLAAALLFGVSYSVSSCKDNDADLFAQLSQSNGDLQSQIDAIKADAAKCKAECRDAIIKEVQGMFTDNNKLFDEKLAANNGIYDKKIAALQQQFESELEKYATLSSFENFKSEVSKNYYTKEEVNKMLEQIKNVFNTKLDGKQDAGNYLTEAEIKVLIEEMLKAGLADKSTITADDVQKLIDQSLVPYMKIADNEATITEIATKVVKEWIFSPSFLNDLHNFGFVKTEDISDFVKRDALEKYATIAQLGDYAKLTDLKEYATIKDLDAYTKKVDLELLLKGYYTITEVNEAIAEATKNSVDKDVLNATLSNYITKDDIENYIKNPDLGEYLTHSEFEAILENYANRADVIEYLKAYVTWEKLPSYLYEFLENNDLSAYIKGYVKESELKDKVDELIAKESKFTSLVQVLGAIDTVESSVSAIETTTKEIKTSLSDLTTSVESYKDALDKFEDNITKQVQDYGKDIKELQDRVDALENRLNNLITGIVCQQIYNPVYGYVNLPFNITSNILIGYYGNVSNDVDFPDSDCMNAYNGTDSEGIFSDDDFLFLQANCGLKPDTYTTAKKLFNGNIGYVYLTINPVNRDFSGATLTLENSKGEKAPIELDPIFKSNDLISFVHGRADNGFYEARATVEDKNLSKIKVHVEDGLKQAVKDVVDNRTASDLASLAKLVYKQLEGLLPAYALKASWDDNGKENAVFSQYNIAATAFQPLSYAFLYDKSFKHDWKLPDWKDKEFNFSVPKMNFTVKDMYIDSSKLHFKFPDVNVSITIDKTKDNLYVEVEMPKFDSEGHKVDTETVKYYADNVEAFINSFDTQLNDYFNTQLKPQIDGEFDRIIDDLVAQMKREVKKMMEDLNTQIESNMKDVIADINKQINDKISKFTGKLDKFIPKVEKVLNKINNFLADPNHYLQPCMFYAANGETYGRVATTKAFPTQLVLKGGDALTLIPSSYNADIIAPAYKKFVAVTDVYTTSASAQGGNKACIDALKDANSQPYMCEVINGNRVSVPLKLQKVAGQNTTYAIVYQAVDYHGKLSTIKCYVTVK